MLSLVQPACQACTALCLLDAACLVAEAVERKHCWHCTWWQWTAVPVVCIADALRKVKAAKRPCS